LIDVLKKGVYIGGGILPGIDMSINALYGKEIFVLATGGLGRILSAEIDEIDEYDANLSLKGLYTLYMLNK